MALWRILDGRRDKEKIIKICNDIKEVIHAIKNAIHSNRYGDGQNISIFPWLLKDLLCDISIYISVCV